MDLLGQLQGRETDGILAFIQSCQHKRGAGSDSTGHGAPPVSTLVMPRWFHFTTCWELLDHLFSEEQMKAVSPVFRMPEDALQEQRHGESCLTERKGVCPLAVV